MQNQRRPPRADTPRNQNASSDQRRWSCSAPQRRGSPPCHRRARAVSARDLSLVGHSPSGADPRTQTLGWDTPAERLRDLITTGQQQRCVEPYNCLRSGLVRGTFVQAPGSYETGTGTRAAAAAFFFARLLRFLVASVLDAPAFDASAFGAAAGFSSSAGAAGSSSCA